MNPVPTTTSDRVRRILIGDKREIAPDTFHKVSLIAFLAWVGLGADGLSSSAYGPEEAFKALGEHQWLAVGLALATTVTVLVIAWSYSFIIEQFPLGGGGYVVASRLLGRRFGVMSGSALIVDYVLTISISIAAAADALFSLLHAGGAEAAATVAMWKMPVEMSAIALLIILNLRGVKESVTLLAPVFLLFLATHALLIGGVLVGRATEFPVVVAHVQEGFARDMQAAPAGLGLAGVVALFLRAYSMGAGTYTGIEAVSNGLSIMREPKVQTGRRTMALMASSLALTAGGLIVAYLLAHVSPVEGKTMNAVLAEKFAAGLQFGTIDLGPGFVLATLVAEAALLFVAAQAGFIDGPRVMANMASDSFLPHRFAALSDRLTMHYGVLLMGGASAAALWYTHGSVSALVVMYSINVFVTFSLSQVAMCRFWTRERRVQPRWKGRLAVHVVAAALCVFILATTIYEKFSEGGWITLGVTGLLVVCCLAVRRHYADVDDNLKRLDRIAESLPSSGDAAPRSLDPSRPTAVVLVGSYAGLGIHTMLSIEKLFPRHYANWVFVAIGVVDSASFTNVQAVEEVKLRTADELQRYVDLARRLGLAADCRMAVDTEVSAPAVAVCTAIQHEFPRSVFFTGKLIFEREAWYQRLLHNETAYQLQRRLQFAGLDAMVLPTRVLEGEA